MDAPTTLASPPESRGLRWAIDAVRVFAPFAAALLVGAIILWATGRNAIETYRLLAHYSLGDWSAITNTLADATPLMLTGLATAFAFRAGVFNVGVEGSLYLGAFAAAWVGFTYVHANGVILIVAGLVLAALAGAVCAAPAALLRTYLGVDEVVTTLMFNFIAIGITSYLVNGP